MIDNREEKGIVQRKWLGDHGKGMIIFLLDFAIINSNDQPVYCIYGIFPEKNLSIEAALQKAGTGNDSSTSYRDMICNILRLAVTVGFLSNNPTVCEADVLGKDRVAFQGASQERREQIIGRAQRRGKIGYNIGTDLMFLGARPMNGGRRPTPTGRELEYAHIRGGHARAVRYGTKKQLVKIMWFPPTTVRDDLPFRPE